MLPGSPPIESCRPKPVDGDALVDRLRLTAVSLGYALAMAPALALAILSILCVPLGAGPRRLRARVRRGAGHRRAHRGAPPGQRRAARRADHRPSTPTPRARTSSPGRALADATRRAGATSGSCGSRPPAGSCCRCCRSALLTAPVTHLLGALIDGGGWWWLLVLLDGPMLVGLVVRDSRRWSAAGRWPSAASSGTRRVEQLERRVERGRRLAQRDARPLGRRGAPDRARPARRRPGPDGRGRHERRPRREADRHGPGGRRRAAPRGPGDGGVGARGPALGGPRHPPAGARRPRAGRRRSRRWRCRSRCRSRSPLDLPGRAARARRVRGLLRGRRVPGQRRQARRRHAAPGSPRPTTATVLRLVVGDDGRGGADPPGRDWPAWPGGSRRSTAQ